MFGTLLGGLTIAHFGWRAMFVGLGNITFLWLWPWFFVTRGGGVHPPAEHGPPPVSYLSILRRREFWGAALGRFSLNYTFYFVITWLPTFLVKGGGFTVSQMAGIGAIIYGVYAVSTAVAGAASDRWIRHGGSPLRCGWSSFARLLLEYLGKLRNGLIDLALRDRVGRQKA